MGGREQPGPNGPSRRLPAALALAAALAAVPFSVGGITGDLPGAARAETGAHDAAHDIAAGARTAALALLDAIDGLAGAERARDRVAALTETIRAHEEGLSALRAGLRTAALRETAIRRSLDSQAGDLARVLGAMMAVERIEPPALMLHPDGPLATARAGMMLADLAPAMQAEADALGALLGELQLLRRLQESAEDTITAGLESLQEARIALSQAMADRRELPPRLADDEARMLTLLGAAQTLEEMARGIEGLPGALEVAQPGFESARGSLPLPVRGALLRRAGETDAAGTTRPGLLLATEPGALVSSPWPGTVRYRGPLLDYANVILIEPAEGYLLVLAGLGTVYVEPGEVVGTDTALGLMPGAAIGAEEFLPERSGSAALAGRGETLYLEIRENGTAIDPEPWFDFTGP
ncbi:MAG: peptidoglycan DD-metalloendopeptidase family protein [Pararhodobacter sp.]|nr:peptidoglycan DD-metalloendopeptidase family protein [Pararhodobacter sp.]